MKLNTERLIVSSLSGNQPTDVLSVLLLFRFKIKLIKKDRSLR